MFHFCRINMAGSKIPIFCVKNCALKDVTVYPVGENAVAVSFGNEISTRTNDWVFRLYSALQKRSKPFWKDLIPAYTTLTVAFDVFSIRQYHPRAFEWVRSELEAALEECEHVAIPPGRTVYIPVCYHPEFAPDMKNMSARKKLSPEKIIELHTGRSYRVFMLGFLPGFAYMGVVGDALAMPRLKVPRQYVPAGSVGIAGNQTGIYPLDSPGGWNIIGRTPLQLFDPSQASPVLLRPMDEVHFIPISRDAYRKFHPTNFNPVGL
jgi:inhibitor of KinA